MHPDASSKNRSCSCTLNFLFCSIPYMWGLWVHCQFLHRCHYMETSLLVLKSFKTQKEGVERGAQGGGLPLHINKNYFVVQRVWFLSCSEIGYHFWVQKYGNLPSGLKLGFTLCHSNTSLMLSQLPACIHNSIDTR